MFTDIFCVKSICLFFYESDFSSYSYASHPFSMLCVHD